jgi:hypothetical protein
VHCMQRAPVHGPFTPADDIFHFSPSPMSSSLGGEGTVTRSSAVGHLAARRVPSLQELKRKYIGHHSENWIV